MERKKAKAEVNQDTEGKIWFQRHPNTHGLFMYAGRYVKPGQRFMAHPDEIPESVRDIIIPMEEIPEPAKVVAVEPAYKKLPGKKSGTFNVVDGNGKVMNEELLSEKEADDLVNSLG